MRNKSKRAELFESVQAVLAEKRALLVRQKGLIETLNRVLSKIGYSAVPTDSIVRPVRRRGRRRGRKPGRPRKRRTTFTASRRGLKRRGRPPKKK